MYGGGEGVAQDLKLAHFFLSAAEAQGFEQACEPRKQVEAALHRPGLDAPFPSKCAHCGRGAEHAVKLKLCPRCKGPFYCGKECQSEHWKKGHKERCMVKI